MKAPAHKTQLQSLKIILFKLVFLTALVFCIDFAAGKLLQHYYFSQKNGVQYRTTYAMEQTTAQVLVFGSSKATHNYRTDILAHELGMSCYNAGRDGNFIFYHYAVLQSVLKRYKPSLIILDFAGGEFRVSQDSYDRLSLLLPYYKNHPEIRTVTALKGPYEKIKMLSSLYPYNSSALTIISGNRAAGKAEDINGYLPLYKEWPDSIKTVENEDSYPVDSMKVKYFKAFLSQCKSAGIKVCVVNSPYFQLSGKPDYAAVVAKKAADSLQVPFADFSTKDIFLNNRRLYADVAHLNDSGAHIFTQLLADEINKNILNR